MLVYVDETGISHGIKREYGWCKKGEVLHGMVQGKHSSRTNVIGAWNSNDKLIACKKYDCNINGTIFIDWVKEVLIPNLKVPKFS